MTCPEVTESWPLTVPQPISAGEGCVVRVEGAQFSPKAIAFWLANGTEAIPGPFMFLSGTGYSLVRSCERSPVVILVRSKAA